MTRRFVLVLLAASSGLVAAQPPATLRLSDEERAALLDHNREQDVDAARAGLGAGIPSRQIHGEFGARGAYGTAAIPLGDKAGATVSFESSRYGHR